MTVSRTCLILLAAAALAQPAFAQSSGPIEAARLSATVKDLASDALQGRGPGTQGETRTIDYLVKRLKALKLEPGGDSALPSFWRRLERRVARR